jgi:hypothetical protein
MNTVKQRSQPGENTMFTNEERFENMLAALERAMQMYSQTGDKQYADLVEWLRNELSKMAE